MLAVDTITTSSWRERERRFLSAHLDVNGRSLRVITLQLESTNRSHQLWGVIQSWQLRLSQAELIASAVEGSRGAVIVAGDLNATPTSRSLRPIRGRLTDSWIEAGAGIGGTWHRRFPAFRIDAVLYDGFAGAANPARFPAGRSDHLAYRVDLILPEE
jgi:endonuclease/exonuclease/phosphatase (EEP) superfamily protein YafD